MNEAEILAKVTGSRGARVIHETRQSDGSLAIDKIVTYRETGPEARG